MGWGDDHLMNRYVLGLLSLLGNLLSLVMCCLLTILHFDLHFENVIFCAFYTCCNKLFANCVHYTWNYEYYTKY